METKFQAADGVPIVHKVIAKWLNSRGHSSGNMIVLMVMELLMNNIGVILEDYSDEIELHVFGKE